MHKLQVYQIELELQNEELKQAKTLSEERLRKYTDLYNFSPVGHFSIDEQGVIVEMNLTASVLLGTERIHLTGRRFVVFVSPPSRVTFNSFFERIFSENQKCSCQALLLNDDGRVFWAELHAKAVASSDSERKWCRLAVIDITARKQAETALLRRTDQFESLINAAPLGVCLIDTRLRFCAANPTACALFGIVDVIGRDFETWMRFAWPKAYAREIVEKLYHTLESGESYIVHERTEIRADLGVVQSFEWQFNRIPLPDGHYGVVCYFREISERVRSQQKIAESEERYRRLFEAAKDGVLLLDPVTCKITDANPFMTQLLDYSHDDLVGKQLFQIGLLKDESASRAMFRKLKSLPQIRYDNLPLKSWNGRHQEVEVVANLYQESGHPVIQCNIRDITERKRNEAVQRRLDLQTASNGKLRKEIVLRRRSEKALKKSQQQAQRLLEESRELQTRLRHIAHQILMVEEKQRKEISRTLHDEISQLLLGINVHLMIFTKAAARNPKDIGRTIAPLRRMLEKSVRMVHKFSRELRPSMLDHLGLIPAIEAYIAKFPKRKGRRIEFTPGAGIEVLNNEKRTVLYRVTQEALVNVAKHARASLVKITLGKISDGACLEIADNGKAFEVSSLTSARWNRRLGLTGMRERVQMVGGRFTLVSSPGMGTTIRAVIPFGETKIRG